MKEYEIDDSILDGMNQQFGMVFEEIKHGYANIRVPITQEHKNFLGIVYGGWLFHMADLTAGAAFISDGSIGVTASSDIQFLRAGKDTEYIRCIAKVVKRGRNVDFVDAELFDDKEVLLAKGSFVFART